MTKKILISAGILSFLLLGKALSDEPSSAINEVRYQVSLDNWATTSTARVIVSVNASLNDAGVAALQTQIQQNLQHIAKVNWNITNFARNQDQSGLEQILITAETRLPATQLDALRANAKLISKPGTQYMITDVQFTPSLADILKTQAALRNEIYSQVNQEIAALDKQFPQQHFYLHQIQFSTDNGPITPQSATFTMAKAQQENVSSTTISNKVVMTANIDIASGVQ